MDSRQSVGSPLHSPAAQTRRHTQAYTGTHTRKHTRTRERAQPSQEFAQNRHKQEDSSCNKERYCEQAFARAHTPYVQNEHKKKQHAVIQHNTPSCRRTVTNPPRSFLFYISLLHLVHIYRTKQKNRPHTITVRRGKPVCMLFNYVYTVPRRKNAAAIFWDSAPQKIESAHGMSPHLRRRNRQKVDMLLGTSPSPVVLTMKTARGLSITCERGAESRGTAAAANPRRPAKLATYSATS